MLWAGDTVKINFTVTIEVEIVKDRNMTLDELTTKVLILCFSEK